MLKRREGAEGVMAAGGGREVLQGFLQHRKKGSSSWRVRGVTLGIVQLQSSTIDIIDM